MTAKWIHYPTVLKFGRSGLDFMVAYSAHQYFQYGTQFPLRKPIVHYIPVISSTETHIPIQKDARKFRLSWTWIHIIENAFSYWKVRFRIENCAYVMQIMRSIGVLVYVMQIGLMQWKLRSVLEIWVSTICHHMICPHLDAHTKTWTEQRCYRTMQ